MLILRLHGGKSKSCLLDFVVYTCTNSTIDQFHCSKLVSNGMLGEGMIKQ